MSTLVLTTVSVCLCCALFMSVESRKLYEEFLFARIDQDLQTLRHRLRYNQSGTVPTVSTLRTKEVASTYTRWGHNKCPTKSSIVCEGYVVGKKHNINGGGSNFLCLTKQPEYTNLQSPNIANNLYGVETDINGFSPSIADKDMTCAVCITQRSSVLMIPGTKYGTSGWNMEYWGYLMSHGVGGTWQPTKYICTDSRRPVAVPGGDRNNGESVVYLVGGVCGSLKCPPYINGKPLTCVVCSR
ncbi:unnamed protein product [Mytilus coruscus]|uniref:Secreted protein n=1 Tax=Mytilus coruscus TaxID=42192 RepID=A0A6J8BK51_MYTCO|nr:unnamed protein product [Mytilus coruscus]